MSELNPILPRSYEDSDVATALFFSGDTEYYWQQFRLNRFGENNRAITLMPMIKDGARHDVVWMERTWINPATEQTEIAHHAACKCLVDSSLQGDDEMVAMENCTAWQTGVVYRAVEVNHSLSQDFGQMIAKSVELSDTEHHGVSFAGLQLDPVDEAMLLHLRTIKKQPRYWEGNIRGGEHQLHLLAVVTGFEAAQLKEHAHGLAEAGWIDFDGDQTLRLAA